MDPLPDPKKTDERWKRLRQINPLRSGAGTKPEVREINQGPRRPLLCRFRVNGTMHERAVAPERTLLELLRDDLDLIGTKNGCDTGDCGACTVQIDGRPALSCLTLAAQAHEREVRTIEGLAGPTPHPLIDALERWNAIQCAFCMPGMVMSAEALLREAAKPVSREEAAQALAGNLCRCTGYTKILDAVVDASQHFGPGSDV